MITKDNNSNKIRIPCFNKFIKDNLVEVSTRLNVVVGETQSTDNSISDSVIKRLMERK